MSTTTVATDTGDHHSNGFPSIRILSFWNLTCVTVRRIDTLQTLHSPLLFAGGCLLVPDSLAGARFSRCSGLERFAGLHRLTAGQFMCAGVVCSAEEDEVVEFGGALVIPRDDVMGVTPVWRGAAP